MTPPPGRRSASAPPGTSHAHQGEEPPGLRPSPTCKRVPCGQGFRRSVVGCDELGVLLSFLQCFFGTGTTLVEYLLFRYARITSTYLDRKV
ncbi:hypothetical protein VPH35_109685 [Triticum aestivum]